jgi:sulfur relay (sulfurtransferase) DsrC/TusE family protein
MTSYDTVTEALQDLKTKGYSVDFNIAFDKIICSNNNICLNPNEFEIVEVFRFEGDTNPDDEDVVYTIESKNGEIKGTLTSAYGMYPKAYPAK